MTINLQFSKKIGGHPKQELVWQSKVRFIDIMAGRRGGKDWISARKFVKRIYHDLLVGRGNNFGSMMKDIPRLHYWCIAPNYKMNAIQKREILTFLPDSLLQAPVNSTGKIWLKPDILIEFKSGEKPESLVGTGLNGVYITETARLKSTVWMDNVRPTLSDKQGWGIFTTTPLGVNWYIDEIRAVSEFGENHNPEYEAFYWKTIENTQCHGLIEEVEKARLTMPDKYFLRNYEASPYAYHGQIFEELDEKIHVQDFEFNKDRYTYVIAGQDWGFTHNGVIVVVGIDNDDNVDVLETVSIPKISVSSKFDSTERTWSKINKELKEKYRVDVFFGGVDRPENISVLRAEGVNIRKAKNAVVPSIDVISTLIRVVDGRSKFRIRKTKGNDALFKGLLNFRWKEGAIKEEPIKEKDDEVDALRYAVYSAYRLRYFRADFMDANFENEGDEEDA